MFDLLPVSFSVIVLYHTQNNWKICTTETFQEITKVSSSRILAVKAAVIQFYLTIFYKSTVPFFIICRIEKNRSLETINQKKDT